MIYKYHLEYEKFIDRQLEFCKQNKVQNRTYDQENLKPSVQLSSYFSAAIISFFHNPNISGYPADDCVGLLPIFVHLSKILNKTEELEQIITDVCLSSPLVLERSYYVFCKFQLEHIAGRLFSKVILLHN